VRYTLWFVQLIVSIVTFLGTLSTAGNDKSDLWAGQAHRFVFLFCSILNKL
jgi:hypothetical protein